MANYVYIASSLDGFIAAKDGSLDWLTGIPNPENSDFGFSTFLSEMDGIIMGRVTFETVLGFDVEWPYPKTVFVLSNTLNSVPEKLSDKAEIVKGDINSIVSDLQKAGYQNLYIDGGKTIQSFLREDLIDELIITRVPVLLGGGVPLFGELADPVYFSEVETETLSNGLVKNSYRK